MDREKIIDWLIIRRRRFQEKKERHLAKNPQDKQGAMLYGVKARALQEVINYLKSQEDTTISPLALEEKVVEIIASALSKNDVRPRAKEILALIPDEEEIRKSERERIKLALIEAADIQDIKGSKKRMMVIFMSQFFEALKKGE